MLLLEESTKNCNQINCKNKKVKFIFNEKLESKVKELKNNIDNYMADCKERNNCNECIFKIDITNKDFQELFKSKYIIDIMNDKNIAKFLFLDQYGIKEIKKDIFNKLVNSYRTDFIFFISSSNVIRFKEMPEIQQYINLNNIEHNEEDYDKSHRVIVEYYKSLLPKDFDYYLHGFSLKKDSNFYGIIFGSGHIYGMEKFLRVCWEKDTISGESNHNINKDDDFFGQPSLNKIKIVKSEVYKLIMEGKIKTNIGGFKFVMKKGCLPALFTDVIRDLKKEDKIELKPLSATDKVSFASTQIHNVKEYCIRIKNVR